MPWQWHDSCFFWQCCKTPILAGLFQPVSDWVVPSSIWDKNLEIQEQTCSVMSMWGDWMALLSSWAAVCLLESYISLWRSWGSRVLLEVCINCPHFHGHPAPTHPLGSACSPLLAVLHCGTLVQEDNLRSLMKTGDWKWEVTDDVYQSTLSSCCCLGMEEFCPNNVLALLCSRSPWKTKAETSWTMVWRRVIVVKIYSLSIFQLFRAPAPSLGSWDFSQF